MLHTDHPAPRPGAARRWLAALLGASALAGSPGVWASSEPAALPETPEAATAVAPAPPPPVLSREIVLELGRRQISLVEGGTVLGSWPVAIGDPRTPTPTGRFTVENKVQNPIYQSTSSGRVSSKVGPQAPLGDRWIGFKQSGVNQYGIHGTPDAWSWTVTSRAAVSNGCVRMLTPHIRQLFEQVDVGTPVIVKP
ncbi:MAG: L,D-transpeptidase [Cyanobacteria bacterium J06638_7]